MSARRRFSRRAVLIPLLLLAAMAWHGEAIAAQLQLTWTDNSTNEDGFKIERKTGTGGTFAQIATAGPNVTSYIDSGVNSGTTYCYRVRAFNVAGDSAYSNEACGTPQDYALAVVRAGTGSGTVTSTPAGITCGTSCSASYASGTAVILTATPTAGSAFTGWSGGGCTGTGSCTATLTATTTVIATFNLNPQTFTLTVSKAGTGSGTVTSAPAGITCGADCSEPYPSGTAVTLTATPTAGSAFTGWSGGGCTGTGSCTVTLTAATTVTGTFTALSPVPTLTSIGPASVTSGGPALTLTATGTNFVGTSVVQVNGSPRTTTVGSATQLTATLPTSDMAAAGTLTITVFTPAPGGGTSNPATLTVTGPTLTVSATTVAPGASVTVTLTNGFGGSTDWLGLAAVGASTTSYLQWTYVGAGVTTRTWTVTMPTTPGQYEFRFFPNNIYNLAATSPPVSVASLPAAAPNSPIASFVSGFYVEVLGRGPDPGGLASWTDYLRANCNAGGFSTVAQSFFDSEEFRTMRPLSLTNLVRVQYRSFLGREPDSGGLAGWAGVFRQARLNMALQGFIPSREFRSLLPDRKNRDAVTAVVTRLYTQILGRAPEPAGLTAWVDFIVATGNLEGAAVGFLTSQEFESHALTSRDYVTILYRTFLGRDPEPAGLNGWEGVLRATLLQVLNTGFIPSPEFQGLTTVLCR